jgi:hypothetical protein
MRIIQPFVRHNSITKMHRGVGKEFGMLFAAENPVFAAIGA